MTTMLENIAKIIAENQHMAWLYNDEATALLDKKSLEEIRGRLVQTARAILQTMREPTSGMYDQYRCDEMWRDLNSIKVWNLWIDAALSEQ